MAHILCQIFTFYLFQAFRKGLNEYLNKFAYKNAFTEDLWDSLGKASGKPVREVMSTWTSKMGFPVLQVCNILIRYIYGNYRKQTLTSLTLVSVCLDKTMRK